MANFVLVHGAWHWGACYQKLAAELLAAGHNVAMPDLASHGFDTTPVEAVRDMAVYTAPALRMIEASSEPVVLLGHSMGGVTCSYLGEAYPEKIRTLVYLAAFMLPNGAAALSYRAEKSAEQTGTAPAIDQLLTPTEAGLRLDTSNIEGLRAVFYADCSAQDVAVAAANISPMQALAPGVTPVATTAARFGQLWRVYIECTQDQAIPIATQRQMQADVPGAEIFMLDASHSPFFSQPAALGAILTRLV